ncbi:MAG: alpha/beta hydrolase [Oscillospiraceae bacterium]|jgi:alpha-beta hydrolase superfamily lysophospholipase|nr:alpha/beta hydrolase [Oscillospiraceae bacterium]
MPFWSKMLIAAAAFLALSGVGMTFVIAGIVFRRIFVRTSPQIWTRGNSEEGTSADHDAMHEAAVAWHAAHEQFAREVSIQSGGLRLTGQYFDFGFDRCVVILSGRTEGCVYSSGFSEPYVQSGWNVLTPDSRAHGFSEGRYATMGWKEHEDLLRWLAFAHDELGNREVVLHGVCVGAATCVYAMTSDAAPDYVRGLTVEGLYQSFYEVLRRRIQNRGHRTFPVLQEIWLLCRIRFGVNYRRFTPLSRMGRLTLPVLFIQSKEDVSSLPADCEALFRACASPRKRLVWMESGTHSHIRIRHTAAYDGAVKAFLADLSRDGEDEIV